MVESVLADVRFALRQLIKSPGFTATAVVTLALGIAINATMFSAVTAFLLPHLPGRDPQNVVVISSVSPDESFQGDINPVSPPNFEGWSKNTRILSAVAAAQSYRRGVYILDRQKLGFDRNHLLTAGILLDNARYPDSSKQDQFVRSLTGQLQKTPGVEAAAVTTDIPVAEETMVSVRIKGQEESRSNEQHTTADSIVTPNLFSVIGLPILSGRGFTDHDDASAPRVVVVSQAFMRKYFQDQDPLGKQIQLGAPGTSPMWSEIVGVVADVRKNLPIEPQVYEAYAQRPVSLFSLMLRSNVEPNNLANSLRHVVSQLDPELPLQRVASMEDVLSMQSSGNPLFARLLAAFAALALVLSAVGIHGLIAYFVGQRTKEIGIRMALGARASAIAGMVLRDGLKIATVGSAIGFAMALPLPALFDSMFNGLLFGAPGIYPISLAMMLLVALGSTLGPARRAARVDPVAALRNE